MEVNSNLLIGAIVALFGALSIVLKLFWDFIQKKMKEDTDRTETMTRELAKNTIAIQNNTDVIKNNTQLFDKVMKQITNATKK